jgi:hypothetical protein
MNNCNNTNTLILIMLIENTLKVGQLIILKMFKCNISLTFFILANLGFLNWEQIQDNLFYKIHKYT